MDNKQILSDILVQILGFAILFFILRRFAWGKLLGAIDMRRKTIADSFQDLEKKKAELEGLDAQYREKLRYIEDEARVKIQEAAKAGAVLSKEIQDKARADAEKLIDRARSEITQDLLKAKLSLRDQMVELSALMTEKIVRAKLTAEDHKRLVDEFIRDIEKVS
jgi:F-type H+-transporting ATPase subunit b